VNPARYSFAPRVKFFLPQNKDAAWQRHPSIFAASILSFRRAGDAMGRGAGAGAGAVGNNHPSSPCPLRLIA